MSRVSPSKRDGNDIGLAKEAEGVSVEFPRGNECANCRAALLRYLRIVGTFVF